MSSRNLLRWKRVENSVADRLLDDSLLHTLKSSTKINKKTKLLNEKLKKCRIVGSYKRFVKLKREVSKECNDSSETEDEPILEHEEYKKIHDAKPKTELQRFLKLCKQTKKRIHPWNNIKKTPTHKPKKSPVGRTGPKLLSKSNKPKTSLKSLLSTSSSLKRQLPKTTGTVDSQDAENLSQLVQRVCDEGETLAVKMIVQDLIAGNEPREAIDSSIEPDSKTVELSGVGKVEAVDPWEEKIFNGGEWDNRNVVAAVGNDSIADGPIFSSTQVFHGDCLKFEEDVFMSKEEKLDLEGSSNGRIDDDKFPDAPNHDFGNNNLSDVDVFREGNRNGSAVDEAIGFDDIIQEIDGLPEDLTELQKSVLKLNGLANNIRFDEKPNVCWLDLRHERPVAGDVVSESNSDSDVSQELALAKPVYGSRTGGEPVILDAANNNTSKAKIRTIERYENGHEILSKYQSPNKRKLETVNNCIDKTLENELPSDIMELLRSRESSENFNSSEAASKRLNGFVDHKNSSSFLGSDQDGIEDEGNKSSKACGLPEVTSRRRNLSVNSSFSSFSARSYDEDEKNSVKTQLMSEIEQRLGDSPAPKKRRFSNSETPKLNKPMFKKNLFNEEDATESFDNQLSIEETESNAEVFKTPEKPRRSSNKSVNDKAVPSRVSKSTPSKRQVSTSNTAGPSMLDALPSKEQARYQSRRIRNLGWFPCELASPEATSLSKKKDGSIAEPTRKKRPKTLEEFVDHEELIPDTTKPHFRAKDIDEDEEVWIMDVPKTINPEDLENRVILLGGKSELTIGNNCYKVSSKPSNGISNVSCVLTKSRQKKEYEIVHIESKGRIKFCQKLTDVPESRLTVPKISAVPFPKNLRIRHPLFGTNYEDKI